MNNILVSVENLSLGYSGQALISGLNLKIRAGEFWTVMGANGRGKSTFIKAILGLKSPLSGAVNFASIKQKDVGYVPQTSSVNPNLPITAEEFVAIATKGLPFSKSRQERVNRAFEEVKLSDKKKRNYWTLSGGEKQRLHIARTMVHSPSLLILDEPDTGLDFVAIENLLQLILTLKARKEMAIVMITHNLQTAKRVSDKCALFCSGKVIVGDSREVLTHANIKSAFAGVADDVIDLWLSNDAMVDDRNG